MSKSSITLTKEQYENRFGPIPLCVTCKQCHQGELVDDSIPMFYCNKYRLWITAESNCKHYEKEKTNGKKTKTQS